MADVPSITVLDKLLLGLPSPARSMAERIYRVIVMDSSLHLPEEMRQWAADQFGSAETAESQRVVRVLNNITGEGALFNSLRALRPMRRQGSDAYVPAEEAYEPFNKPLQLTPEDPFGRVEDSHGVTAANVSRYDSLNSLVIFSEQDPLAFTPESVEAHFLLALEWFKKAHAWDAAACYPYVMWNCLWRSGGSVVHGHLQMTLARNMHYARIERLRRDAGRYLNENGVSYFDDLFSVHEALGCGFAVGESRVMAHLTPVREKEVMVLAQRLDSSSLQVLHDVLAAFRDRLGVRSFNVGIALPPMAAVEEPWDGFPVMIRIVDRGNLDNRTSDVGGMELFAESVVASDPFAVAAELRDAMGVR